MTTEKQLAIETLARLKALIEKYDAGDTMHTPFCHGISRLKARAKEKIGHERTQIEAEIQRDEVSRHGHRQDERDRVTADIRSIFEGPARQLLFNLVQCQRDALRAQIMERLKDFVPDENERRIQAEQTTRFREEIGRETAMMNQDATAARHAIIVLERAINSDCAAGSAFSSVEAPTAIQTESTPAPLKEAAPTSSPMPKKVDRIDEFRGLDRILP